ncbi:MAG: acyl-CoA dehydrogenase family protein [Actinobacteria bacterium]|nr:acyl-CoA dehydrogenase family protein [Actinomycetota bacterium]
MDFELSTDQVALRDAARDLLGTLATSERVRQVVEDGSGLDHQLWQQVAAQGWLAIAVPEESGGLGLGAVELAVLAEQVGRHVAPIPFTSTAAAAVVAAEVGALRPWHDDLIAGATSASLAYAEELAVDAPHATLALHVTDDHVTAVDLRDGAPQAEPAMDLTRQVAWLDLSLGGQIAGADRARRLLDLVATLHAAELLGTADRCLEMATDYAKVREQFGRPIGSFQAVKHRLADMLVDVEGMRSAAYYAAWAVATDAPDRSLAASVAKSWCGDAARRVTAGALQVHGGVGFTWEHDLHLYLKRAQLTSRLFGDATLHRRRVTRLLRERVEAGADLW